MKYIAVTHVDSATKIPGYKEPMIHGPTFPEVKGLNIEWWDYSRWPITHPDDYPLFYGTCDDDADIDIPGVMKVIDSKEIYDELHAIEVRNRLPSVVSPLQFRYALIKLGLFENIQTAINSLNEPAKTIAMMEWEYAVEIDKNSNVIQLLATQMGLTSDELDNIFVVASEMALGSLDPFEPF